MQSTNAFRATFTVLGSTRLRQLVMILNRVAWRVNFPDVGEKGLHTPRETSVARMFWEGWNKTAWHLSQQRSHVTWLLFVFWLASRWRMILLTAAGSISGGGFFSSSAEHTGRTHTAAGDASMAASPPPMRVFSGQHGVDLCWLWGLNLSQPCHVRTHSAEIWKRCFQ